MASMLTPLMVVSAMLIMTSSVMSAWDAQQSSEGTPSTTEAPLRFPQTTLILLILRQKCNQLLDLNDTNLPGFCFTLDSVQSQLQSAYEQFKNDLSSEDCLLLKANNQLELSGLADKCRDEFNVTGSGSVNQ